MQEPDPRRLPSIAGGRNFRDLGGYATRDGRHVRWGRVYRSGSLAGFAEAGQAQLRQFGIRAVCDLRSTSERAAEPYAWCDASGIAYWARDYGSSFAELRKLMSSGLPSADAAAEAMIGGYRAIAYHQAPAYREIFRRLVAGEVPLVFNCSAGKDRAGVAAALILTALGVPRETVLADYLLTNEAVDFTGIFRGGGTAASGLAQLPDGVFSAIFRADAAYLDEALSAIEARSGSFEAYLREELDVDRTRLATLCNILLE